MIHRAIRHWAGLVLAVAVLSCSSTGQPVQVDHEARARDLARQFLIAQGVDPSRVAKIAYGKERPVALCDAESCWSQNRRAVTIVTGGAVTG